MNKKNEQENSWDKFQSSMSEEKGNTLKTCLMLMASGVTLGRPSQTDTCEVNT